MVTIYAQISIYNVHIMQVYQLYLSWSAITWKTCTVAAELTGQIFCAVRFAPRSCHCHLLSSDVCQRCSEARSSKLGPPVSVFNWSLVFAKDHLKAMAIIIGEACWIHCDIPLPRDQKATAWHTCLCLSFPSLFLPKKIQIPGTLGFVKVSHRYYEIAVLNSSVSAVFVFFFFLLCCLPNISLSYPKALIFKPFGVEGYSILSLILNPTTRERVKSHLNCLK